MKVRGRRSRSAGLGHEPVARGFESTRCACGGADEVAALRGEALAGAEAQVREDAGVGRALGLLFDALDEVVSEEVSGETHERVLRDGEREEGVELQTLLPLLLCELLGLEGGGDATRLCTGLARPRNSFGDEAEGSDVSSGGAFKCL